MAAAIRYIAANGCGWLFGSRFGGRIGFNVRQYWLICPSESLIVEAGEEKRVNLCDAADG
jgi:hypothetical protein